MNVNKKIILGGKEVSLRIDDIEGKNTFPELLKKFISERGKILSRRVTGTSAKYQRELVKAIKNGKTIVVTTQVPNEGSDISLYEVGNLIKKTAGLLESYDMTTEACLAKLMWVLAQTDDPKEIKKLFYTPVANDMLQTKPE